MCLAAPRPSSPSHPHHLHPFQRCLIIPVTAQGLPCLIIKLGQSQDLPRNSWVPGQAAPAHPALARGSVGDLHRSLPASVTWWLSCVAALGCGTPAVCHWGSAVQCHTHVLPTGLVGNWARRTWLRPPALLVQSHQTTVSLWSKLQCPSALSC